MIVINRKIRKKVAPYLMALPTFLLIGVFLFGVISGVMQGFGIMPFLGRTEFTLNYYVQALTRPDLVNSILYSLYFSLASAIGALIGGVALAAAITRAKTGRIVRLLNIQIPIMTMHALVALAVICIFSGVGLFPRLLNAFGIINDASSFPSVIGAASGWGIILVYLWKEIPFIAFCTVTIMANISDTFGEAASTLGASSLRTFFSVTLPLCKGAIVKAFLIVFAFAFGSYEIPFLLGPTLPKALPVLAYIEFQDPDIINRCYAMALNGVMVFICTVIAMIYFALLGKDKRDDA